MNKNKSFLSKIWEILTYDTEAEEEEERRSQELRKSICKFSWQLSKFDANETYSNGHDNISFTDNVISSARKSVKEQHNDNPDWDEWVREWESETVHINNETVHNK